MNKSNIAKQQELVGKFNAKFPVGSTVQFRTSQDNEYRPVTVARPAYIAPNQHAVTFFEEISGFCSVDPMFVDYAD
jgi:hypothetical protein